MGTFRAWGEIPDTTPKWLRVHSTQEWADYYEKSNCEDQRRFFDYYLKGRSENGWLETPKVRLSILNFGLRDVIHTVGRAESTWPLGRTQYIRHYLTIDHTLSLIPKTESASPLKYDALMGKLEFRYVMPAASETTGYFMARILVSSEDHNEMDIFVQVEKLTPELWRQGVMTILPERWALRRLLKFLHDWQIVPQSAGLLFDWGPSGSLRASHALEEDSASTSIQPVYSHSRSVSLQKGEIRALAIPFKPYGMYWEVR